MRSGSPPDVRSRPQVTCESWIPRSMHFLRSLPDLGEIDSDVSTCVDALEGDVHQADELKPAQALIAEG